MQTTDNVYDPLSLVGIAAKVLPLGSGNSANSWTTVPNASGGYHALVNTGSTLRPTRVLGGSLAAVGTAPDGKAAMGVFFARGSFGLNSAVAGGISFYAYGPSDLSSGNEFTLGYSIFFESGFGIRLSRFGSAHLNTMYEPDFVHGGKLPGLYGGTSNDEAASCSGGRHPLTCFSTRLMWRDEGAGEVYVYLPNDPANKSLCNGTRIPGKNICGSDYGTSLGRGSFHFETGKWNYVAQRIKLNTPGKADGQLQASTKPVMNHKFFSSF
ncbi:unnamed protein product [Rhizoctonia solani]|uniref:Polysaccharide lyase 14 domain-containing protein n=1 Tax=Rhizoctonia solani TaxID=456999 RepID=A0A8H3A1Y9_9AGAM|nr:unnamed protein product [Rhizoctonia solani]